MTSRLLDTLTKRLGVRNYYDSGKSPEYNRLQKQAKRSKRHPPPPRARHDDDGIPHIPTLPLEPNPTYAQLNPSQQSKLRLHLMNSTARIPTPAELQRAIPAWLVLSRKTEAASLKRAFAKVNLAEWRSAQLDQAWVWKRKEEQLQGIPGTDADRHEDQQVALRQQARQLDAQLDPPTKQDRRTLSPRATPLDRFWETPHQPLTSLSGPERMLQQVLTKQRTLPLPPRDDSRIPLSYSRTPPAPSDRRPEPKPLNPPQWLLQRQALQDKFPDGWAPPKRLSREAISLVKLLQQSDPARYTTPILAERFRISPEAVRRILKSKFELPAEDQDKREAQRKMDKARQAELDEDNGVFKTSWAGDVDTERREMERFAQREEEERDSDRFERRHRS